MTDSIISKLSTAIAALAMAALPIAAQAQQAQPSAPARTASTPFGIPAEVVMLDQQDPNMRTATARVNGAVITGTDIDQRVALVLAASERSDISAEEMQALRMQVLRNLIDETLQIQAAAAQEMEVTPQEIEARYQALAQQNFGEDPSQMDAYLTSNGSSPAALKRQIQGEVAWQLLLRRNVSPFVNVSAEEVNEMIERQKASRGQDEYRIAEIYLSATPETAEAVRANGQQIMDQIRDGGSFAAYARQFSESTTAAVGGDLGFVRLATLPDQVAEVALEMQPGQIVGPVPIPGGFVIMVLLDKRQVLTADPRDATLSLKQIAITFEPGIAQAQAEAKLEQFTQAVGSINSCATANQVAQSVGASVIDNNSIPMRNLPEQLQASLSQLQIGQATPPFGSLEEGVRVLLLCGRDDPQVAGEPDFDSIMDRLEEERISKRAQRYLRDLRNDAIIEYN